MIVLIINYINISVSDILSPKYIVTKIYTFIQNTMEVNGYILEKILGSGSFGVTYSGYRISDNLQVAIKTINLPKASMKGLSSNVIKLEVNTLDKLAKNPCNQYVQCYYESFTGTLKGSPTEFIVSEYIDGFNLRTLMRKKYPLQPGYLWKLYSQLLNGLKFIHDRGYAHRDIKPDNILIDSRSNIKYIDFGLSCIQNIKLNDLSLSSSSNFCKGIHGTKLYFPPEFLKQQFGSFNYKAQDMWSLTMTMYELADGDLSLPFDINDINSIANAPIYLPKYNLDDGRTNIFLQALCQNDPLLRPSIKSALTIFEKTINGTPWVKSAVSAPTIKSRSSPVISPPQSIGYLLPEPSIGYLLPEPSNNSFIPTVPVLSSASNNSFIPTVPVLSSN